MTRGAAYWIATLSLTTAFVHAASSNTPDKPKLLGNLESGRMSIPAVKIPSANLTVRPRGDRSSIDVGSDWYIPAWIGKPPKLFYLLADSAANNLEIESTLAPVDHQGTVPKYDPTKSTTAARMGGYTWGECFWSGYCANGVVYTDTFTAGQISIVNMRLLVQTNNTSPNNGSMSGNLGLNFDKNGMSTSPTRINSYFQEIMPHLECKHPRRTSEGQFQFGYIDPEAYIGSISYGPVTTTGGEWTVEVQGVGAGYADSEFGKHKFTVLVDTGSGGGSISREAADLYWRHVPSSVWHEGWYNYLFQCNHTLPDFVVQLANGVRVGIPDDGLRWKSVGNGQCITILGVGKTDDVVWGSTFIEAFFVIFDWGKGRVGLATKSAR
ncbi:acid protease [Thozetella sp. PMI_491]|nr:acid protease [Thozetella sp. PMI_491]